MFKESVFCVITITYFEWKKKWNTEKKSIIEQNEIKYGV